MELKPVNKINSDANTIRVSDGNSPIRLIFKDAKGEVINLYDKIDYFYLTKDDETFYSVTDISYEGDEVIFRLPKLRKGQYKAEIRDKDGSIYPANEDLYILLRRSFEDDKDIYYFGHREDILNNVEPIIIQHIEQNPNKFKGERGPQGFPGRDGLPGIDGKDGKDGVDGEKGDPGKDGSMSFVDLTPEEKEELRGERGRPGLDGKDGIDGIDGLKGEKGLDGLDGLPGKDGVDGLPGKDGVDGAKGEKGDPGLPGKDGVDGAKGEKGDPGLPGKDGAGIDPINDIRTYYSGTGSYTQALKDALLNTNHVIFPDGTFNIGTGFNIPSGVTIEGQGNSTILNTTAGTENTFKSIGNIENEINITVTPLRHSNTLTVADTSTLSVNDIIMIRSQKDCLKRIDSEEWFLGFNTSSTGTVPFGEFKKIVSIDGNVITLESGLIYPDYDITNVNEVEPAKERSTITKVNMVNDVTFKNFKINRNRRNRVFYLRYCNNVNIENVFFNNNGYKGGADETGFINMINSLNCEVKNSTYYIDAGITTDLMFNMNVFKLVSCQQCGFKNVSSFNSGQSIDMSYISDNIPNTLCYIEDSNIYTATHTGITTHGGNFMTTIKGNKIYGGTQGIAHRGRKALITDNTLVGDNGSYDTHYGIGLYQGGAIETVISNNNITNFNNGITLLDGGTRPEGRMRYMGTIISDNSIKNCDRSIRIFRYDSGDVGVMSTEFMGIVIKGNSISMLNGMRNQAIVGIELMPNSKGIMILNNIIKGIESEGAGIDYPRRNNYRGLKIHGGSSDITVSFNSFIDLDYGIDGLAFTLNSMNVYHRCLFREKD